MFSYELYKVVHLVGLFFLFLSLGGMCLHAMNGGTKESNNSRKILAITHGVSLLVTLTGGFGLLARLGMASSFPIWLWPKLAIWLIMGGIVALIYRAPQLGKALWFIIPILGLIAAYLGVYKPG